MKCADVNLLIAAAVDGHPHHETAVSYVRRALSSPEPLGIPSVVISGFVRICTDRRVLIRPMSPTQAVDFVDVILSTPGSTVLQPQARHWEVFSDLVRVHQPRSADVTDVYLAALAIEQNATLVSFDRGFARFPELRWELPTDPRTD